MPSRTSNLRKIEFAKYIKKDKYRKIDTLWDVRSNSIF